MIKVYDPPFKEASERIKRRRYETYVPISMALHRLIEAHPDQEHQAVKDAKEAIKSAG